MKLSNLIESLKIITEESAAYNAGFSAGKTNAPRKGASYGPGSSDYDRGYSDGQKERDNPKPRPKSKYDGMSKAELDKLIDKNRDRQLEVAKEDKKKGQFYKSKEARELVTELGKLNDAWNKAK